ncbi:hypothetical protein DFH06DRAFT_1142116 [Mycena polygramma]|nr:hypothetical protein DFH06DRAFT_1142116 [Mycena polygramma]
MPWREKGPIRYTPYHSSTTRTNVSQPVSARSSPGPPITDDRDETREATVEKRLLIPVGKSQLISRAQLESSILRRWRPDTRIGCKNSELHGTYQGVLLDVAQIQVDSVQIVWHRLPGNAVWHHLLGCRLQAFVKIKRSFGGVCQQLQSFVPSLHPPYSILQSPLGLAPRPHGAGSHLKAENPAYQKDRRLSTPDERIDMLLQFRHLDLYADEDEGHLYFNLRARKRDIRRLRARKLSVAAFKRKLSVNAKIGHTKNITRRRCQYRRCDEGDHDDSVTHIWAFTYKVPKRYLAERLVHEEMERMGAHKRIIECPSTRCNVHHREFVTFASVGGLSGLNGLVKRVLGWLGLPTVQRRKFKASPYDDILELLK